MTDLLQQLDTETCMCINCGFCDSVCPTLPASNFNPIMGARGRINLAREVLNDTKEGGATGMMIADSFYSCLDCYACLSVCPAGVNAGKVSETVREIVATGRYMQISQQKPLARMIVSVTMKYFNPLGVREKCADWAKGLTFENESDTLLYTGNMYQLMAYTVGLKRLSGRLGSRFTNLAADLLAEQSFFIKLAFGLYNRGMKKSLDGNLRNIVELLRLKGIGFGYMGKDEPYSGALLHDLGYKQEFEEYAKRVTGAFKAMEIKKIVTVDPHTYHLLKFEYPKVTNEFDFEVMHYLDFFDPHDFVPGSDEIAYHEPCLFVTRDTNYDAPLKLLSKVSKVRLPRRNGKKTFCCGGPDELLFDNLSEQVSYNRFSQLKETGGKKIVTACPICFINLAKDESIVDISSLLVSRFKR